MKSSLFLKNSLKLNRTNIFKRNNLVAKNMGEWDNPRDFPFNFDDEHKPPGKGKF